MAPTKFVILGFLLLLLGAALPFLIIIDVLESTFFLSFLSYGSMVSGLVLGFIGVSIFFRTRS